MIEKTQEANAKVRSARDRTATSLTSSTRAPFAAALNARAPETDASSAITSAWAELHNFSPAAAALAKARIVALAGGHDAAPFDVMRTKVLQTMRANNWRRLAITSPTPACGKSTITLNLGFSLTRQPEIRTLLAEIDLRRPSLARSLNYMPNRNFADVLRGEAALAEAAICYNGNLAIALNRTPARNPAELLHGVAVPEILDGIEATYAPDLTIFDMPPMLVSDDAMVFAEQVDCVLLVAAAEATTVKEIDICERELATQTNVMGVVLNKCRFIGKEYGYSYYG